jgi:hypothetical protein
MIRGVGRWVSTDEPGPAPFPGNVWTIGRCLCLLRTSGEHTMESFYEDYPLWHPQI